MPVIDVFETSHTEKRHNYAIFAAIILLTIAVRLPLYNIVHEDEAFYAIVAQRWLNGEWPYSSSFDVKPPLTFAVLALFQSLFGMNFAVIKAVEILATALAAFGVWRLLQLFDQKRASIWGAVLAVGFSLPLSGASSPAQLIQMALTTWAFVKGVDACRNNSVFSAWLSGLYIGLAILTKQTALFDGFALAFWYLSFGLNRRNLERIAVGLTGALLPLALCLGSFYAAGSWDALIRDVGYLAIGRANLALTSAASAESLGFGRRIVELLGSMSPLIGLQCAMVIGLTRYNKLAAGLPRGLIHMAGVWFACACLGVLTFRNIMHFYSYPIVVPAVVLSALTISNLAELRSRFRALAELAAVLFCVFLSILIDAEQFTIKNYASPPDIVAAQRTTEHLKRLGLKPDDTLLVPIRGMSVYILSGALPRTPYFNSAHLMCDFPTPSIDPLGEALNSNPDFIVLSDLHYRYNCITPDRIEKLKRYIGENYIFAGSEAGIYDSLSVYRRRDRN